MSGFASSSHWGGMHPTWHSLAFSDLCSSCQAWRVLYIGEAYIVASKVNEAGALVERAGELEKVARLRFKESECMDDVDTKWIDHLQDLTRRRKMQVRVLPILCSSCAIVFVVMFLAGCATLNKDACVLASIFCWSGPCIFRKIRISTESKNRTWYAISERYTLLRIFLVSKHTRCAGPHLFRVICVEAWGLFRQQARGLTSESRR